MADDKGYWFLPVDEYGSKISRERIEEFERYAGIELSQVYVDFLLKTNGGLTSDNSVEIADPFCVKTDVHDLFGLDQPFCSSNLEWNLEVYSDDQAITALNRLRADLQDGNMILPRASGGRE